MLVEDLQDGVCSAHSLALGAALSAALFDAHGAALFDALPTELRLVGDELLAHQFSPLLLAGRPNKAGFSHFHEGQGGFPVDRS